MVAKNKAIISTILIIISVGVLSISGWFVFLRQTKPMSPLGGEVPYVAKTETAACNGKTYIINTSKIFTGSGISDYLYFTDIYREYVSLPNLLIHWKNPYNESVYEGKTYVERSIFSILAVPLKNCGEIYLTTVLNISHPLPAARIFKWQIGTAEIRELAVSKEFSGEYTPYPHLENKIWMSPDGGKILVAKRNAIFNGKEYCNFRILRLIDLRNDSSEILVQLPEDESFDNGNSDLEPYCEGLSFGWLNESEIYYDIYDATTEYNRQLLERKTLSID